VIVLFDGEPAAVDALLQHRADELLQEQIHHPAAAVRFLNSESGAIGLAAAHEREQIADGPAVVEGEKAAIGEEFATQPDVVGTECGLALFSEYVVFELHQRGEIVTSERSHLISAHRRPP
jgi:hypothetical protein